MRFNSGIKPFLLASSMLVSSVTFAGDKIEHVRSGVHGDFTRVVFDVSGTADMPQVNGSADGRSITLFFEDGESAGATVDALARTSGISAIFLDQIDGGTEIRLALNRPMAMARLFPLKPYAGRGHRLVLDIEATSMPVVAIREEPRVVVEAAVTPATKPAASTEVPAQEIPDSFKKRGNRRPVEENKPPVKAKSTPPAPVKRPVDNSWITDFSGLIELEGRYFTQASETPVGLPRWTGSVAIEPDLTLESADGDIILTARPFARFDSNDDRRSHVDIREAKLVWVHDRLELKVGMDVEFWGVTESAHLVDIINQDDAVEDLDSEDKLGQPMVALSYDSDFGLFSFYSLPYTRVRAFPGLDGRPNVPVRINRGATTFWHGGNKWHNDLAARWSHSVGQFDLALSHFRGTSRDPRLVPIKFDALGPIFAPFYDRIDQTGIELQGTFDGLLIKGEAIRQWRRGGFGRHFTAAVGFEYTLYGLSGGESDLGLLAEYLHDSRGDAGPNPFEEDAFVGLRWALNDVNSTEFLGGAIFDLDSRSKSFFFEASRRVGDSMKLSLDARFFIGQSFTDPMFFIRDDDFLQLRLAWYF